MGVTGFRKKSIRFDLALLSLIVMMPSWFGTEAHGETFVGKAVNSKGALEYVEYHTVTYRNGKVSESQTVYYDANNSKIGELTSEYSFGPQFGSYDFRDIRAQHQDGAKVAPDKIGSFESKAQKMTLKKNILRKKRIK
jgi:hypothetical protein